MPGPITAYRIESAEFESAWQEECHRNGWPGEYESPAFKRYWEAYIQYGRQRDQLEQRHFKIPGRAKYANSRLELWAYITKVSLVVLWAFRSGNQSTDRRHDPAVLDVLSALHSLQIPWADTPPYPELAIQEVEDKLRSIANRLEKEDLEAEPLADNTKKSIENIENPQLRLFVDELRQIKIVQGTIPRGKRREIALKLCKNNIKKAESLERGARAWKHLIK